MKKRKASSGTRVVKKAIKHLSEDMEGYRKERKYLLKEIKEDKELQKDLRKAKNAKKRSR